MEVVVDEGYKQVQAEEGVLDVSKCTIVVAQTAGTLGAASAQIIGSAQAEVSPSMQ